MFLLFLVLLLIKNFSRKISEALDQAAARQCTCLSGMLFFSEGLELLVAINMSPLFSEVGAGRRNQGLEGAVHCFTGRPCLPTHPNPKQRRPDKNDKGGFHKRKPAEIKLKRLTCNSSIMYNELDEHVAYQNILSLWLKDSNQIILP